MLAAWIGAVTVALAVQGEPTWIDSFLEGSRALERGELAAARAELESALQLQPDHAATAWQLAGACARAGDADEAFAWLERVLDWGGSEVALLDWDPDLASLREDARFATVRERLRRSLPKGPNEPITAVIARLDWNGLVNASSSGELVIAKNSAGLHLYDLRAHETLGVIGSPGEDLGSARLSDDGRWLVAGFRPARTGSASGTLRVCDARTGDTLRRIPNVAWHGEIQFSRDGERMLVSDSFGAGGVWETRGWTRLANWPVDTEQTVLAPDGSRALLLAKAGALSNGVQVGSLSYWDVDRGEWLVRHEELDSIVRGNFAFSAGGSLAMALGSEPHHAVHVFDGRTGERIRAIDPVETAFRVACFLGETGELATLEQSFVVRIWNARDGRALRSFPVEGERGIWLDASLDGRLLLVNRFYRGQEMFDALTGELLWSCGFAEDGITGVEFAPDGSSVVTEDADGLLTVRDARTGAVLAEAPRSNLGTQTLAHPSRDEIWVSASDGSLRRIDARTGRALDVWEGVGWADRGLHASADGKLLAGLDGARTVRLIEAEGGRVRATIPEAWPEGYGSLVSQFDFAPDGSSFAVAGYHPRVSVYGTADGKPLCTLDPGDGRGVLAYRPDGKRIAVAAASGRVLCFDPETGAPAGPELTIEGEVETLAFEPAGERLWVGSDHSHVHVFDAESGVLVRSLALWDLDPLDTVELGNITFDREGELAVTTSSGLGVVAAWRVATGERTWGYSYSGGNPASLSCAFSASGERAYVWGQTQWTPRVVDAASGRTLLDLGTGGKRRLLPLPSEDLLGVDGDEGLEMLATQDGARRWSRIELERGGWLLQAPSRHVDGTRAALERLHLVLQDRSYPLDALAASLLDPKKVRAEAEGVVLSPTELAPIPGLSWKETPPRVLHARAGEPATVVTLEAACPDGIAGFEILRDGQRSRVSGEAIDASHRRLTMNLERPSGSDSVQLRWRAISGRGVLSRALHLTLEPAR